MCCFAWVWKLILEVIWASLNQNISQWIDGLCVFPCHTEALEISLTYLKGNYVWLRLHVSIKDSKSLMWPYIGHAVWNVPICLCVCACYLRQLLTQLWAGGPWHQCGWREARYWRRVQPVLNPGLLEGSLSFSPFTPLFLSPLSYLLSSSVCKTSCETVFQFDKLYEIFVASHRSSPWDAACWICKKAYLKSQFCNLAYFLGEKKVQCKPTNVSW